jgi:hypothetical protein
VVATVVTAAAAVAVVVVLEGRTTVGQASAASTSAPTVVAPDAGSGGGGTTAQPTVPSETAPAPVYPTTSAGGIDLSEVTTNPVTSQVAAVLDTYFGSINAHDGAGAASVFDASGTIDPNDPSQVADFTEQISTTHDDQVVLHSISANGPEYLADVSFRSQQAAQYGPDGQTCTNWHLTYRFTSGMKLIKAINATYSPC